MFRMVLMGLGLVIIGLSTITTPAMAQERELVGTFRDWNTFREVQDGQTVCYAVAIPDQARLSRRGRQRGDVFFFVTTWEDLGVQDQVNVVLGYPVDEASTPTVSISNESFDMFGRGERLWLLDADDTAGLLNAMRGGSRMIVRARSERGTDSTDEYSLLGATAALESATEACQ